MHGNDFMFCLFCFFCFCQNHKLKKPGRIITCDANLKKIWGDDINEIHMYSVQKGLKSHITTMSKEAEHNYRLENPHLFKDDDDYKNNTNNKQNNTNNKTINEKKENKEEQKEKEENLNKNILTESLPTIEVKMDELPKTLLNINNKNVDKNDKNDKKDKNEDMDDVKVEIETENKETENKKEE